MPPKAAPPKTVKRAFVPSSKVPTLNVERGLWAEGHEVIVGVDEVGRGAWAGPLMVGAAVLPQDRRVYKVRDSKMLSEAQRERLFDRVAEWCVAWSVGGASQVECDELGMADAQRLAARRAIDGLGVKPDHVLVDGNWDFVGLGCTKRIVKGDITCLSISAASILAKVTRDRLMRAEAPHFPAYDFDSNKGYPCPRHKMALQAFGPTSIHRRTWVFMDHLPWTMRVYREAQQALFEAGGREVAERPFTVEVPQVDPWGGRVPVRR
jgi:ribonuclease HII